MTDADGDALYDAQAPAVSPLGPPTMTAPGIARLTGYVPYRPSPAQRVFLMLRCLEAFYGGAAGGAKSWALLMGALQFVDVPNYSALIIRKTYKRLSLPNALIPVADSWLRATDARWRETDHTWRFPSGATLTFGYADAPGDERQYQSAAFQYIAFDELTEFLETPYRFLFTRCRRPALPCVLCDAPIALNAFGTWEHSDPADALECEAATVDEKLLAKFGRSDDGLSIFDVPLRVRSASNPGGDGHGWVKRRLVDPITRRAGVVFVPSKMQDNPYLDKRTYLNALKEADPVDYLRVAEGDWTVKDPGEVFDKTNVVLVEGAWPRERRYRRVRRWDLAATEPAKGKTDPDFTAGILLALDLESGRWRIEHIEHFRQPPDEVERRIRAAAERDGRDVPVVIEQEPGSSGKALVSHYLRNVLRGFEVHGDRVTGPKEVRIRTTVPIVENGLVEVVAGPQTDAFLDQLDAYPHVDHDDMVDAFAGAHDWLASPKARLLI